VEAEDEGSEQRDASQRDLAVKRVSALQNPVASKHSSKEPSDKEAKGENQQESTSTFRPLGAKISQGSDLEKIYSQLHS
jgi:hypothetical protein